MVALCIHQVPGDIVAYTMFRERVVIRRSCGNWSSCFQTKVMHVIWPLDQYAHMWPCKHKPTLCCKSIIFSTNKIVCTFPLYPIQIQNTQLITLEWKVWPIKNLHSNQLENRYSVLCLSYKMWHKVGLCMHSYIVI